MIKILIIVFALLIGCSPTHQATQTIMPASNSPTPIPQQQNLYIPKSGDTKLEKGPAFVEEAGVLILKGNPQQFELHLSGNLPDPCHELRISVDEPDTSNNIKVDVYSVSNPEMVCIQVLKAFSANFELGSFPTGHYSVIVNGDLVAEFDA